MWKTTLNNAKEHELFKKIKSRRVMHSATN